MTPEISSKWICVAECMVSKSNKEIAMLVTKDSSFMVLDVYEYEGITMVECFHSSKTTIALPLEQLLLCFKRSSHD